MKYSSWKFKETAVMDFLVEGKYTFRRHLLFLVFFSFCCTVPDSGTDIQGSTSIMFCSLYTLS